MIKTYKLKEDQSDKIEFDNVEVVMTEIETFTKDFNKTPALMKAEIAKLDKKLLVVAAYKAEKEAELVEIEKEVVKYKIKEEN